jgi:hypothetical protein
MRSANTMNAGPIRCRIAACREDLDDDNEWSFYLINDGDAPLQWAVLDTIGYEWGGMGNSEQPGVRVTGIAPGGHALLWRDDGSGAELRMDLSLRVCAGGREAKLLFEFPKLYRKTDLPVVAPLGKPGWAVAAQG